MKILLFADRVYTEPTNGAARSLRTVMEWLASAGHSCRAVGTGRFDQSPGLHIRDHHSAMSVSAGRETREGQRPVVRYALNGVSVLAIESEHPEAGAPDPVGTAQLAATTAFALETWRPDVVLSYGPEAAVQHGLAQARRGGARTIYAVRNWGYNDPGYYRHADRVLMPSRMMAEAYAGMIGLRGDALPSPIVWADVVAPSPAREFVTFINPTPAKGLAVFARLADMLGRMRPDIPLLVVESGGDAGALAAIPELGLAQRGNIVVSPPRSDVREVYALTRLLLVPSVFAEPSARVAAEALVNGIPPLVSTRGGLPETVGAGGLVLPVPDWLTPKTRIIPSEAEVQPWFDAVTHLWDDAGAYTGACARARAEADARYAEAELRGPYNAYFSDPGPFPPVLASALPAEGVA